ncbi:activity-dependent neuroprotector homeobox protein 2 isoform X2 [Ambystoma mexicanum]|uniref:activity-dependent neuroprotector homeobox protein 2 isoform X2 n=1 Tax=Ambystoma mexicanum TaxID=8296 RepID=UPI0037E871F1
MFQVPVNNLERIRRARKKVKGILLDLGLESCRDLLQRYRTKPFCCSLCNFSSKLPSSLKNHLHRNHEEEIDQELVVPCPSCAFSSQSKTVVKHMRMFHTSVRKVNNFGVNNVSSGSAQSYSKKDVQFSCQKCSFTDTLYYSIKKHVLVTHFENIVAAYFGEIAGPNFSELHQYAGLTSEEKSRLPNKYYCKKCHTPATCPEALIYHILTSEKHRDLEFELRTLISEFSKAPIRKMGSSKQMSLAPKTYAGKHSTSPAPVSGSVPMSNPACVQLVSFPQHNRNQLMVGQSSALQSPAGPMPVVSNAPVGMMHTSPASVMTQSCLSYLPNSIPVSQNMSLQSSLSQPIFVSQGFHINQSIGPGVHPGNHGINSGVLPPNPFVRPGMYPPYQPVRGGVLPPNQSLHAGGHPMNQSPSGGFSLNHSGPPRLFNVNQSVGPGFFPPNQNVRPPAIPGAQSIAPGVFSSNQYVGPGVPQNNFMSTGGPLMRQLIPTGQQVNGIPTFTIGPVPVTLPASTGGGSASNPQVPMQLNQSNSVSQVSLSPSSAPSPPVTSPKHLLGQAPHLPPVLSAEEKNTKQWKTCPVCSELFPSNVYQVHMQVAHKLQGGEQSKEKGTIDQEKLAAQAPYLRWVKEKVVRCLSCKCFISEEGIIKHLLMHGLVCLFCTWTFHDLKSFVEHNAIVHSNSNKIIPVHYLQRGLQLAFDANRELLFPHFDFNTKMPKEEIGVREVLLAVLPGTTVKDYMPIYIKVQPLGVDVGGTCVKQAIKCPFCLCAFAGSEVYETHLKDRHHIMPTVHTILRTPAFKCIHCCGVYTGNMTLAAISVHLLRCRSAPKDSSSAVELVPESNGEIIQPLNGEKHNFLSKRNSLDSSLPPAQDEKDDLQDEDTVQMICKRKKIECAMQAMRFPAVGDHDIHELALDPTEYECGSKGDVKRFLSQYFHKRPYPTKKELEILSSLFALWKIDVADFFVDKQEACLEAIESQQSSVVMGFNMCELKNMKHRLNIGME